MFDPTQMTREQRAERDREIKARPATTGDIERLMVTVNRGWVGRGFAIGFGIFLFGLIPGVIFGFLFALMSVGA